jgi:hypothetical protein
MRSVAIRLSLSSRPAPPLAVLQGAARERLGRRRARCRNGRIAEVLRRSSGTPTMRTIGVVARLGVVRIVFADRGSRRWTNGDSPQGLGACCFRAEHSNNECASHTPQWRKRSAPTLRTACPWSSRVVSEQFSGAECSSHAKATLAAAARDRPEARRSLPRLPLPIRNCSTTGS